MVHKTILSASAPLRVATLERRLPALYLCQCSFWSSLSFSGVCTKPGAMMPLREDQEEAADSVVSGEEVMTTTLHLPMIHDHHRHDQRRLHGRQAQAHDRDTQVQRGELKTKVGDPDSGLVLPLGLLQVISRGGVLAHSLSHRRRGRQQEGGLEEVEVEGPGHHRLRRGQPAHQARVIPQPGMRVRGLEAPIDVRRELVIDNGVTNQAQLKDSWPSFVGRYRRSKTSLESWHIMSQNQRTISKTGVSVYYPCNSPAFPLCRLLILSCASYVLDCSTP